jgi:hypothetical protein
MRVAVRKGTSHLWGTQRLSPRAATPLTLRKPLQVTSTIERPRAQTSSVVETAVETAVEAETIRPRVLVTMRMAQRMTLRTVRQTFRGF